MANPVNTSNRGRVFDFPDTTEVKERLLASGDNFCSYPQIRDVALPQIAQSLSHQRLSEVEINSVVFNLLLDTYPDVVFDVLKSRAHSISRQIFDVFSSHVNPHYIDVASRPLHGDAFKGAKQ